LHFKYLQQLKTAVDILRNVLLGKARAICKTGKKAAAAASTGNCVI
jgi:hypothetical protein